MNTINKKEIEKFSKMMNGGIPMVNLNHYINLTLSE